MATSVTDFEIVLNELGHVSYARFLSTDPGTSVSAVLDVIEPDPIFDPLPWVREEFHGRIFTWGWSSRPRPTLDLRIQVRGFHDWPTRPVVVIWQREPDAECHHKRVLGCLLLEPEVHEVCQAGSGDSMCTTFKVSFNIARLLEGAP